MAPEKINETDSDGPVLLGDIGGTNCRLALARISNGGKIEIHGSERFEVAKFANFNDIVACYLDTHDIKVKRGAFAFAGPKFNDEIQMTNLNWTVSEAKLRKSFNLEKVVVLNDFVAMATGATVTADEEFDVLIPGKVNYNKPVSVLGPGTGLGLSFIVPGRPIRVVPTEGGHAGFAPVNDLERKVLEYWSSRLPFVSAETLLSGPGLVRLYESISAILGRSSNSLTASEIVLTAKKDKRSIAYTTTINFCSMLGGFAGNAAVTQGASGGVIIGGGVSRHITPFIQESDFVQRFKSRGPGSWYVANIPVRLIRADFVPLYGAAATILTF